jgi:phosphatidylethanolamine-binding protein (PEBP) family uncharacterized protein
MYFFNDRLAIIRINPNILGAKMCETHTMIDKNLYFNISPGEGIRHRVYVKVWALDKSTDSSS